MTTRTALTVTVLTTALFGSAVARAERPVLLVVQVRLEGRGDSNLDIDSVVADELDKIGQVSTLTWSITDSTVRSLDSEGKLAFNPVTEEFYAHVYARQVGAKYVLLVAAWKEDFSLLPFAKLCRPGSPKALWSFNDRDWSSAKMVVPGSADDEKRAAKSNAYTQAGVQVGGSMDWDSTARSIAASWASMMASQGLKGLPRNPRPNSGGASEGSNPGLVLPKLNELDKVRSPLRQAALRDAVDREPERLDLRVALFDEQIRCQEYMAAVRTAELASRLEPNETTWQLRAAHAFALDGQGDKAAGLARRVSPSVLTNPLHSTRMGDVALASGDYQGAEAHYSLALAERPSPEALVGHAVACALQGKQELCAKDLAAVVDAPGDAAVHGYRLAVAKLAQAASRVGSILRDLVPQAKAEPSSPAVVSRAQAVSARAHSLSYLVANLRPPSAHRRSHALLDLACKLLDQSSQEVLLFAQTGSSDLEDEAGLSLNEALLQLPGHRALFLDESVITETDPL